MDQKENIPARKSEPTIRKKKNRSSSKPQDTDG